jgi:hypothetical protein
MGRQQPKIPIASGHGSDPELNISDANWSRIERALGIPLSAEARSGIYEATYTFLFLAGSGQNAEPISAARKTVQRVKKSSKNFQGVIFDFPPNVGREAGLYARHLVNYYCDPALKEVGGLQSVAAQMNLLVAACDRALKHLEDPSIYGLRRGDMWKCWIQKLDAVLLAHNLPTGARKDADKSKTGLPSPYVAFVRELQACLPAKYQRSTQSDEALAKAIYDSRNLSGRKVARHPN